MVSSKSIKPVQPYLKLNTENYKELTSFNGETEDFLLRLGISNFYEFTVRNGEGVQVQAVPDGSTDLVFAMDDSDIRIYIGGTVLKAKDWEFEEGRIYFGARFLPGKCILPESLSIREVVDTDLELHKNEYGMYLPEYITEGKNIEERALRFTKYFKEQLMTKKKDAVHNIETYICNRIYATNGTISIKQLSEETGYSECYVRRAFQLVHGISPKVFERFVRFQNMLQEVSAKPEEVDIEDLAMQCGYYDQSHMMKDFKAFTGTTPEKYRKMLKSRKEKKEQE